MFTCLTFSGFFLSFIQHLEHHFNHFCPVSWDGVSQDTVSCSRAPFTCVARQQWKRGWQNKAHAWNTSLKDPPCQLPFTVTLATTTQPPLLWLTGGQVNAKAWKAWRSIYLFWKNGQPSRSLHEKMIKYIPAKETGEAEWASSRAEKNHFTGRFWMADRGAVLTCVTSNIKTQAAGTSCWQSSLYMFDLVLLLLNIKGYWLFADFFWDSWTNSHLLKKMTIFICCWSQGQMMVMLRKEASGHNIRDSRLFGLVLFYTVTIRLIHSYAEFDFSLEQQPLNKCYQIILHSRSGAAFKHTVEIWDMCCALVCLTTRQNLNRVPFHESVQF